MEVCGIMKELFMSCKMKNIVLATASLLLLSGVENVKAQGAVSLSEDAMFDDELETTKDFPDKKEVNNDKSEDSEIKEDIKDDIKSSGEENIDEGSDKDSADVNDKPVEENKANEVSAEVNEAPVEEDLPILAVTTKKEVSEELAKVEELINSNSDQTGVDDLFSKMSDIEKSTTLLNLELRRERLQNEIEAVRNQRRQAAEQERLKAEEQRQKQLEKEREEERKKREEEQKLRELDIQFEKLRQEKILKAYKNQMLEETQKWIARSAVFQKSIADLREEKKALAAGYKSKLENLKVESEGALKAYNDKVTEHKNEVQNLNSQIDVLRNRIVSLEQELEEKSQAMIVGGTGSVSSPTGVLGTAVGTPISSAGDINTSLSHHYAILEIRGQGGELVAKLLNRSGISFYVKKGTALQSGHVVSEITSTYVAADKNFKRDYIYFSSGGILPQEIDAFEVDKTDDK